MGFDETGATLNESGAVSAPTSPEEATTSSYGDCDVLDEILGSDDAFRSLIDTEPEPEAAAPTANEATAARGAKGDHRTGLNQVPNIA